MPAKNRISVSFSDEDFVLLDRLSVHTHRSKAELIRVIVREFLENEPNRFRRKTNTGIKRDKNILLDSVGKD